MTENKERYKKFAINKKAWHDYEILDRFEAGIVLTGSEVKVIRQGKVSIADAFVRIKNGEMYIMSLHIAEYESKGYTSHDPDRDKKLLMHKNEIIKIGAKIAEKGLSVIPLCIYPKDRHIKVELGLARGRKLHDKREDLKRKAMKRDVDRNYKIKG